MFVGIRHSLRDVPRREREQVARDPKPVYTAVDADAAQQALERFDVNPLSAAGLERRRRPTQQ